MAVDEGGGDLPHWPQFAIGPAPSSWIKPVLVRGRLSLQ